jgi:hypothetical protein
MSSTASGGLAASLRRVSLLVTCGIVAGLAWTDAGHRIVRKAGRATQTVDVCRRQWYPYVPGQYALSAP